jgi:ubiquitin carboxyl-terminal hydrolase 7
MCFMGKKRFIDTQKNIANSYFIISVLVHSGDLSGGHYFAFVKPEKDGKW